MSYDRSIPWNEGGKELALDNMEITMSHDDLAKAMGNSYQKMIDAGFVMMPRKWREDVFKHLSKCSANS